MECSLQLAGVLLVSNLGAFGTATQRAGHATHASLKNVLVDVIGTTPGERVGELNGCTSGHENKQFANDRVAVVNFEDRHHERLFFLGVFPLSSSLTGSYFEE